MKKIQIMLSALAVGLAMATGSAAFADPSSTQVQVDIGDNSQVLSAFIDDDPQAGSAYADIGYTESDWDGDGGTTWVSVGQSAIPGLVYSDGKVLFGNTVCAVNATAREFPIPIKYAYVKDMGNCKLSVTVEQTQYNTGLHLAVKNIATVTLTTK